jgi:FkbM family methyltransferase
MNLAEYERIRPNIVAEGITFLTPNQHCAWRVNTLLTKEPDTIDWINSMKPGEVLFDVGACMGGYSLYAASKGIEVHAFEPESQNFALLCSNIAINKYNDKVTAWPIAISNENSLKKFYLQSLLTGGSCSSYGEQVDYHLNKKEYAFSQGSIAITLDDFSIAHGNPDHIKIDVDGLEHDVIVGSIDTLQKVKSVLVELNTALKEHNNIFDIMKDVGLLPDMEAANKARRKEGPFTGIGNVIFYRK